MSRPFRSRLLVLLLISVVVPFFVIIRIPGFWYVQPASTPIIPVEDDDIVMHKFLNDYKMLCENRNRINTRNELPICPCFPKSVVGWHNVSEWYETFTDGQLSEITVTLAPLENTLPLQAAVGPGGHWKPGTCIAHQRVAIIIPFRNRHKHLQVFSQYMHSFLQRQLLDYTVFVIEQDSPAIFNRAALMNIGFLEANKANPEGYDCYIFHDVDLLPEDDHNMYTCYMAPIHLGAYMNKFEYKMPYPEFFGGAIGLSKSDVERINGFPNKFYGWGGEDDDIYIRVQLQNLTIKRYPEAVGRSFMFKHDSDEGNPINPLRKKALDFVPKEYLHQGLSTVRYKRTKVTTAELYTIITVSIEQEYDPSCIANTALPPEAKDNYVNCLTKENYHHNTIECCRVYTNIYCCNTAVLYTWVMRMLFLGSFGILLATLLLCHRRIKRIFQRNCQDTADKYRTYFQLLTFRKCLK